MGVIRELPQKRPCRITGVNVAEYESTGDMPIVGPRPRRLPRRDVLIGLKLAMKALIHLRAVKSLERISGQLGIEVPEILTVLDENIAASGPVEADTSKATIEPPPRVVADHANAA